MTSEAESEDKDYETEIIEELCADCGRKVEAPRRFFLRKAEQGTTILCKICLEEKARQTHHG